MKKIDSSYLRRAKLEDTVINYPNKLDIAERDFFNTNELSLITPYSVVQVLPGELKIGTSIIIPNSFSGGATRLLTHQQLQNGKWWYLEEGEKPPF
jgi:hypothetical protein